MGMLPQVPEIIFEVQRKISNENITRKEISFPTYKTRFFFLFFLFGPFLFSNVIIFFIFIHLK
jgi:hypothetical protein